MDEASTDGGGLLKPGEGTLYTARGSVMAFKAVAAQTGGDFSLMERTLPAPGPGTRRPPAHRHTNCSEAFFVLDGSISFELDGRTLTGGSGDFVLVPRGAAHTFGNAGAGPARLLVLHAPAMDGYFAQLHELWSRDTPPATDEERALMARFGMSPA
jgi:mannose-6-phosphate isomerase-like protein (cupin superfamily)